MIEQGKEKEFVEALRETLLSRAAAKSNAEKRDNPEIVQQRRDMLESRFAQMDALRFDRSMSDNALWRVAATKPFYAGHTASTVDLYEEYMFCNYLSDIDALSQDDWDVGNEMHSKFMDDPKCYNHSQDLSETIRAAKNIVRWRSNYEGVSIAEGICWNISDIEDEEYLYEIHKRICSMLKYTPVTGFHVMMELGFPVVKPDRVVNRIAVQMGIIERYKKGETIYILDEPITTNRAVQLGRDAEFNWALQAECRRIAKAAGISMRLLDYMLVKLGQVPDPDNGLVRTICTEVHPQCGICSVKPMCAHPRK